MKKFLSISCFLFLQTISCSFGTLEIKPEATKLSIQNNSRVQLQNVKWNNTDFGNIGLGNITEMMVYSGNGPIYFNASNGKRYYTQTYVIGKEYEHNKFTFINNTIVIDASTKNASLLGGILNVD